MQMVPVGGARHRPDLDGGLLLFGDGQCLEFMQSLRWPLWAAYVSPREGELKTGRQTAGNEDIQSWEQNAE